MTEGLDRARESLNEAATMRDRYVIGSSVSRRVAAAAASAVSLLYFSSVSGSFLQSNTALSKNYHYMGELSVFQIFAGRGGSFCW